MTAGRRPFDEQVRAVVDDAPALTAETAAKLRAVFGTCTPPGTAGTHTPVAGGIIPGDAPPTRRRTAVTDTARDYDDDPMTDGELQTAAMHIGERFTDHDQRALADLTAEQRAGYEKALRIVYAHVDDIWEAPKLAGTGHPVDLGGYGAVAGMRDLLMTLIANVENVGHEAGDRPEELSARMVVDRVE